MEDNQKELKKKAKMSIILPILLMLLILVSLTSATYAWFTFIPSTNVTPMGSTISNGDTSLLISNTRNGEYAPNCALVLNREVDVLKPVSTYDLEHFYSSIGQSDEGVSIFFEEVKEPDTILLHGTVYLKCIYGACDVFFYHSGIDFGVDSQVLAASRLGLRITKQDGSTTQYIMKLDSLMNGGASEKETVAVPNSVIQSVAEDHTAAFRSDESELIGLFMTGGDEKDYRAGDRKLCTLQPDEIASVEYWFYLEGCDKNCFNDVKNSDVNLQFAFAGVEVGSR